MNKHNITSETKIDIIEDEIISIELIGEEDTIDITVEDTHLFFANDIYTHNSAIDKEKFSLDVISESLGKAQTADVILGLARPDEMKKNRKAALMILKNRNGVDGETKNLHFDTSKIDIYVEEDISDVKMGVKGLGIENQIRGNNNNN
jgi:replicative DNA helicase